jgi:tetratricopeptide (TPR) repeat protein
MYPRLIVAAVLGVASVGLSAAPGFKGANYVVEQLIGKPEADEKKPDDSGATLKTDLEKFAEQRASTPPTEAATKWLKLADQYFGMKPAQNRSSGQPTMASLLSALPEPAAWPALQNKVVGRDQLKGKTYAREIGLLLLVHTLNNDIEARGKVIDQLDAFFQTNDVASLRLLAYSGKQLLETMSRLGGDSQQLDQFTKQLEQAEAKPDEQSHLDLPDLVTLVGRDKAAAYLNRLFATRAQFDISQSDETMRLARKVALENIDTLRQPHWGLVNSTGTVALYEALDKKFPRVVKAKKTGLEALENRHRNEDRERDSARFYYLIGLILSDRTEDATRLVKQIGAQQSVHQFGQMNLEKIVKAGGAGSLYKFFHALLSENADSPYWQTTVFLAAQVGKSAEMIVLAESALKQSGISAKSQRTIRHHLMRAQLAADKPDAAVRELRILLADDSKADDTEEDLAVAMMAIYSGGGGSSGTSKLQLALTLAQVGSLLENKEWLEEGLTHLTTLLSKPKDARDYTGEHVLNSTVDLLIGLDRGPEAEALLIQALVKAPKAPHSEFDYGFSGGEANGHLSGLIKVYHHAGRHADIVRLLDAAPNWGVGDVLNLMGANPMMMMHDKSVPIAYFVAQAFAKTGQSAVARKIAREFLYLNAGVDSFYELLVELDGQKLMPLLDELYRRDQFEERPLIWKAHLLRLAGKLDEAEAVVKSAIAVDPSDGEQGKNDRMRVYGVYADIHRDRGNLEKEEFFRGVLRAIRMSENADDLYAAGLFERGIRMYQDSLKHFSDAYCIQSRMAIQLSELGQHEEAEKYYLKAYELMPDSFGRVESHCFGCERAFNGERAQSLAERVFTRFALEHPKKPQIHYLLGYLRDSQRRYSEALVAYRRATELDPEYLNAWAKIGALAERMKLPAETSDAVALNLMRLDPLARHVQPEIGQIQDLVDLWNAAKVAAQFRHETPATIYPLAAAAAELAAKKAAPSSNRFSHYSPEDRDESGNPADLIARHELVQAISQFIDGSRSGRRW